MPYKPRRTKSKTNRGAKVVRYKRKRVSFGTQNPYMSIKGLGFKHPTPFPNNKTYKLTYAEDFSLSVGTAGVLGTIKSFNLNSIYDPDRSGGGHQPYGYDAIAIAYNRYKVHACLVTLQFYNCQTINAVAIGMALMNPAEVASTIANIATNKVNERPNATIMTLQKDVGKGAVNKRIYIPMYKAFNVTRTQFKSDLDNTTAAIAGDPGAVATMQFAAADPNGGSSGAVRCKITLTYYVQMYQGINMAQS